jgi:glycosyltransferase involved in cell wall biosynthesis
MTQSISLIIPALNEQDVILNVLSGIFNAANSSFDYFEIILVDDGSSDSTGGIMDKFAKTYPGIKVIHNESNRGLGASFQIGLGVAQYEYVMLLCGDGGLPAKSLPKIFSLVGQADVIIPYMENLRSIKSPQRYILSRTYVKTMNLISGFNLRYYNGLPVYRRALLDEIKVKSSGFGFQAEILFKLLKSGCTYKEVGVDGAEETGQSDALRLRNVLSVSRTLTRLMFAIYAFKPIPIDVITKARQKSKY